MGKKKTSKTSEEKSDKEQKKTKSKKSISDHKAGNFRRNTNGLGVDHPYEFVNISIDSVEYDEGIIAPF